MDLKASFIFMEAASAFRSTWKGVAFTKSSEKSDRKVNLARSFVMSDRCRVGPCMLVSGDALISSSISDAEAAEVVVARPTMSMLVGRPKPMGC